MQKLIAKYGLAAHLAILAVAPLFLFPFVSDGVLSVVMLWLAAMAALWTVLEPSIIGDEHLHDARRRVAREISKDPLFWATIVLVLLAGIRALNSGISLAYNAETSTWHVSSPVFPLLPGSVGNAGFLPFSGLVALGVLLQGCRHSLGRSARMAYLLVSSALSGLAAVVFLLAVHYGLTAVRPLLDFSSGTFSFVGMAFGLHLLAGTVALLATFENRWNFSLLLLFLSIGGNAAGLFSFSPAYVSALMAACELLLVLFTFAFACKVLHAAGEFKLLVVFFVSIALGCLLTALLLPSADCTARLQAYARFDFFARDFWDVRSALSRVSFKSWISSLWIGTGLSSFPFDFRFNAVASDWKLLPHGTAGLPFGWWMILAERGIVGMVAFVTPVCLLLFTYFRRMSVLLVCHEFPHPSCLLVLSAAVVVAAGFFDCSFLRVDVLMAAGAVVAISASAFPKRKKVTHG